MKTVENGFVDAINVFNAGTDEAAALCMARKYGDTGPLELFYGKLSALQEAVDVLIHDLKGSHQDMDIYKEMIRQMTDSRLSISRLINHARTWPHGFQGDHEIVDAVYDNIPTSEGFGRVLDMVFLSSSLAKAVRGRRLLMQELLRAAIVAKKHLRIFNLGCGPSREICELEPIFSESGAFALLSDYDSSALTFTEMKLRAAEIPDSNYAVEKLNALKVAASAHVLKPYGVQDIVYSLGLVDYLSDDTVVRLLNNLYMIVNSGGRLVVSFKDAAKYHPFIYHWMCKWDKFLLRDVNAMWSIMDRAGFQRHNITTVRERTGVIVFFIITKP